MTSAVQFPGRFDSARHEPFELTWYYRADLNRTLTLGPLRTKSVYINDKRFPNGTPPSTDAYLLVDRALVALRDSASKAEELLLMSPYEGIVGRPHATGGVWIAPKTGIAWYVARCPTTTELWCNFLCADVDRMTPPVADKEIHVNELQGLDSVVSDSVTQ